MTSASVFFDNASAAGAFSEESGSSAAALISEESGLSAAALISEEPDPSAAALISEESGPSAAALISEEPDPSAAAFISEESGPSAAALISEESGPSAVALSSEEPDPSAAAFISAEPGLSAAVQPDEDQTLAGRLLAWYDQNRRSLPWRDDPSPYHVWISEIMLQQTRVEAVKGYYQRFLERFPDVRTLAVSEEDECLKAWEGLGYYSRARNLRRAAKQIVDEYQGEMPETSSELARLPGIGPYTSAAIASIAFGERIPAIDGNLLRIFARLTLYAETIRGGAAMAAAKSFYMEGMSRERPGDFNQALMDLGAGICTPGPLPSCSDCPLKGLCGAFMSGKCASFPVMPEKKPRVIVRRTILVIRDGDWIVLRRRPPSGLLAGMYELPGEERWIDKSEALSAVRGYGFDPVRIRLLPESKHVFTHREWHMRGYEILISGHSDEGQRRGGCFAASLQELKEKYALPGAFAAYLPAD